VVTVEVADTRTRIRAVAIELFTTQGYEQTSLREIADRVGVTKASLYYHYPSKQELLLAVLRPLVLEWREAVDAAVALPHTPANVRWALENCLDTMLRHRSACALFIRDTAAILATVQPLWAELLELSARLNSWLAGPSPSSADRIRAVAATETLGVALTSTALMPDVPEDELRRTLLESAAAVLGLRRARTRPVDARAAKPA
jgi:AcrR family transcriptional regulator